MTSPDPYAGIPLRPPSVAEWEDLLVKLEIGPRALRAALDDAPAADPEIRERVTRAAAWESVFQKTMEALRGGTPLEAAYPLAPPVRPDGRTDTGAMAEVFTSLRMRTFAMAQRRGVDVWEWESERPDGTRVSAYQLLTRMVRSDARLLADLRERVRALRGAAC